MPTDAEDKPGPPPEDRGWLARPVFDDDAGGPATPFPGYDAPREFVARPVTGLPYHGPAPVSMPSDRHYPDLAPSPPAAAIDLIIVSAGLFMSFFAMGGLAVLLMRLLPEMGIFWANSLAGIVTIALVFGLTTARQLPVRSLGLTLPSRGPAITAVIFGLPACYLALILSALLYMMMSGQSPESVFEERQELMNMMPRLSLEAVFLLAIFPGFHEELLFRGFALPRMCRVCRSKWLGVLATSALFGALHAYQGTMGIVQTAALGMVFAGMAILTRSIWPAMIVHAMFNGVSLWVMTKLGPWMEEMGKQLTSTSAPA